jgi:hypothetical protein
MSSSVKAPAQSLPPTPMTVAGDYRLSRIRELQQTYSATQKDLARLEERIELLHALVAEEAVHALADPDRNATLARHQYDLGVGLYEHFMHVRDFSNLTAAEAHLRSALYRLPLGASSLEPGYALGAVLRERASGSHSILLVEEALVLHRQPFAFNFNLSNMERAHNSRELGLTLRVHYAETGTQQSLKEGAQQLKVAHALFTDAGVADHACSAGLVLALVELYDLHSDKAHLSEASSIGDLALMQCRSAHRDFYNVVSSVSKMRRILAWYCDDVAALLSALDILRVALEDAPLGWATPLTIQLVTVLRAQFVKHGREEDLLEATAWVTTLLDRLSPGASRWEQLQASLAYILWLRFTISGQADVIEQAAHTIELALTKVNAGTPDYFHYMTLLATCREAQYSAFGDIDHLNQCITLNREASRSTPLHSIDHMVAQHNFMCALKIRAEATDSLYDLNEAIELAPDSHSIQTADPTNAPTMLLDIGSAFLLRFEITGSLDDLERATTNHREAAQAWTSNSSQGFAYHNVLSAYAKVLRIRYEVLDEKESVEKALVQQKQLVDVVPTAHADRSRVLCGLAQTLTSLYLGQDDLEKALDLLLDALHNAYCPAYRRLKDVMDVLRSLATSAPQLSQENALKLSVVYSTAIALLPQVASFGLDPRTRLSVISGSGQLTTQAASHAISIGQYELALEMLEAGRSVFWTQGLHLRTPFTDLPPAISDRLKNITSALGQPMPDSSAEGPAKDRELARRRRLGDDFTAVLAEARLLPGFEGLLQNISFSSLARASQQHPIVVLVAGENIAHALIILEDARCIHVTLEKAASGSLKTLSDRVEAHSQHVRSRGVRKVQTTKARPTDVYRELWALVMLPIVTALGWSVSTSLIRASAITDIRVESTGAKPAQIDAVSHRCLHAAAAPCSRHLHRK